MKILLATPKTTHTGGGIPSYNQELVKLFGADNEIDLLTQSDEPDVKGFSKIFSCYGKVNTDFGFCSELIAQINDESYDLIINSASAFIPVIAPFLYAPIITVSHFVDGKLAYNAGYNAKYLNAIIALSEYGKNFIISKFGIRDTSKVHVVYNFVHTDPSDYDCNKHRQTPVRIVYPGGTSISKSIDVIQRLLYRLLATDWDFEFIWIGGTNLPSANLSLFGYKNTQDLFQADRRLKITGLVDRATAQEIIASANIFLLPSRGEGCPMTLLEAMRAGCIPIVSDAKHGSREIIEDSKAGVIVRQGSSKTLMDTISDILSEPDKYEHLYLKSHTYMLNCLSQKVWREKMMAIISKCLHADKHFKPLTRSAFIKSAYGFKLLCLSHDLKLKVRSVVFRIILDSNALLHR